MRAVRILSLLVFFSGSAFGQQSASAPTTLSGCVLSLNGIFSLTTSNGNRYVLKGDHDTLLSYNGKQVQVTGTLKAAKKTARTMMAIKTLVRTS